LRDTIELNWYESKEPILDRRSKGNSKKEIFRITSIWNDEEKSIDIIVISTNSSRIFAWWCKWLCDHHECSQKKYSGSIFHQGLKN
jgi:hypothetical protein